MKYEASETKQRRQKRKNKPMSVTSITNPSLCSSPLPRSKRGRQNPLHSHANFSALSDPKAMARGKQHSTNCVAFVIRVSSSATESEPSKSEGREGEEEEGEEEEGEEEEEEKEEEKYEEYEVEIEKPYGLRFTKGRDGSTYIDAIAPGSSAAKTNKFAVGDKVIATSAVFGEEIWPAAEYGRTMYTIRQRVGPLFIKMQKRYGKPIDTTELTEKEIIRAERNAGFISNRIREIQIQNYMRKKEQKEVRENDLREGLSLYKGGKYEEALEKFESVLGSKPEPEEASVANYNVACCYSKLNRVNAGISALEDALKAGYDNFKRIRSDPDLANVRATEEFEALMKKYDESFINENAINAIKSLFGIFKKK